jgi:hypothetical protein
MAQSDLKAVAAKHKGLVSLAVIGAAARPVFPDTLAQFEIQRVCVSGRLIVGDAPFPFLAARRSSTPPRRD